MNDRGLKDVDGLRQALAYVLPQVNSSPTVAGCSPTQWVLGYQPDFAGDLTSEGLNPSHLDGSNFEQTLEKRSAAKVALIKADQDQRLRRALLRRYSGTNVLLQPGQICWYWRDARAADLVKVRWKGPARVILREMMPKESRSSTGSPIRPSCFDVLLNMSVPTTEWPLTPTLVALKKLAELSLS